jgi:transposase InsO family protein
MGFARTRRALRKEPRCPTHARGRFASQTETAFSTLHYPSRHNHKIAENWLSKVPAPDRPGQLWQSDITYLETAEGWLYLAFTLDGCSRRIVAHHCREDLLVELTTFTLDLAATRQRPAAGLIHHSDRGSQYAAEAFQRRLSHWGVTSSMSRKANPYDNALAESFVATLKSECFGGLIPPTKAAAKPARPASKDRSALAALAVNNSPELFKSPETTRSNHLNTRNSTPDY